MYSNSYSSYYQPTSSYGNSLYSPNNYGTADSSYLNSLYGNSQYSGYGTNSYGNMSGYGNSYSSLLGSYGTSAYGTNSYGTASGYGNSYSSLLGSYGTSSLASGLYSSTYGNTAYNNTGYNTASSSAGNPFAVPYSYSTGNAGNVNYVNNYIPVSTQSSSMMNMLLGLIMSALTGTSQATSPPPPPQNNNTNDFVSFFQKMFQEMIGIPEQNKKDTTQQTAIDANTTAITANDEKDATQQTAIDANTSAITANDEKDATQQTAIDANTAAITANDEKDATQQTAIDANTNAINENNTKDETQQTEINANKSDIAANNAVDAEQEAEISELKSEIEELKALLQANIAKDTAQDSTIASTVAKNAEQDAKIAAEIAKDATQDTKIAAIEVKNAAQDTAIAANNAKDATQDTAIAAGVTKDAAQDAAISAGVTKDAAQDAAISAGATKDAAQDAAISAGVAKDATQDAAIAKAADDTAKFLEQNLSASELKWYKDNNIDLTTLNKDGTPKYLISKGQQDGKYHVYQQYSGTVYKSVVSVAQGNNYLYTQDTASNKNMANIANSVGGDFVVNQGKYTTGSPLILDTNGNGTIEAEQGKGVDIDQNGAADGAAANGDKMLAMGDLNHNGKIDGSEVFGNETIDPFTGAKINAANGFEALKVIAQSAEAKTGEKIINENGKVDLVKLQAALKSVGSDLGLISGENVTNLEALGDISKISVNYEDKNDDVDYMTNNLNNDYLSMQQGSYETADGQSHKVDDVWFKLS